MMRTLWMPRRRHSSRYSGTRLLTSSARKAWRSSTPSIAIRTGSSALISADVPQGPEPFLEGFVELDLGRRAPTALPVDINDPTVKLPGSGGPVSDDVPFFSRILREVVKLDGGNDRWRGGEEGQLPRAIGFVEDQFAFAGVHRNLPPGMGFQDIIPDVGQERPVSPLFSPEDREQAPPCT